MYGLSKITFELQPSLAANSIPQKWDELRRKVLNIQPQLPSGASTPTVSDDFGDVFGIYDGLTADEGYSYEEMRNWAERIKTLVVTADGVMKVALFGVQTEVVNIYISTNKLVGMGIDPKQLASLLQSQNQIINTGEIRAGEQQLRVTANGMYTTVDDIRNQVITTKAGQVKLGDIAVIEKGYMDPPSNIMHVNGKRAIGIGVSTDPQRDVVQTGENVKNKLNELLPLMPVGLELQSLYLENEIANEANNGFIINLIESILIVIVIIMLVMGLRAGILIGSSLIFSIGGTLLIMSFFGVGLNRTSLAGFIIAMGMLVDNAIVVTDNAQIAIARGVNRRKALIDGATGPQWGLLGATFIAICSFLPLYLAPSSVAEIVKPLFVVLAISLGLSWVLALTQTTVFGNFILKAKVIHVFFGAQVAVLKTNLEAFLQTSAADQVSSQVSSGEKIKSPMNGTVIPLSEVPDAVFSSEMLGKGFGVEPSEGKAYAPVDGEVTTVFDTKHAIGLMSKHGVELLIHIGMDTVKLNGKGFDVKVKTGDQVKAGDLLAEFDMDLIKGEGYPVTTAVVVTNTDDCEEISEVRTGAATKDTEVLTVKA